MIRSRSGNRSKKHGRSGKVHNIKHFTGRKLGGRAKRKRKLKNDKQKRRARKNKYSQK